MMDQGTFFVLGGYGAIGLPLARLILHEIPCGLVIAGRNLRRAEEAARQLAAEFPGRAVRGLHADAADRLALLEALQGCDAGPGLAPRMVVSCISATELAGNVAWSALQAGWDYLDVHFSQENLPSLQALSAQIEAAGRCFITQAGFHPGLPSVFVRYAASRLERLERAVIGGILKQPHLIKFESARALLADLDKDPALVYRQGSWRQAGWRQMQTIDFGGGFGQQSCFPIDLYEMHGLVEGLGIGEAGVYMAGFNWFVDSLVVGPAYLLGLNRRRWSLDLLTRCFVWGTGRFTRPPFGCVFKIDAWGQRDGQEQRLELRVQHADGYLLTAIPIVACLQQILDGTICRNGLWLMGHVVDPDRLLKDMERMGVQVTVSSGNS